MFFFAKGRTEGGLGRGWSVLHVSKGVVLPWPRCACGSSSTVERCQANRDTNKLPNCSAQKLCEKAERSQLAPFLCRQLLRAF